jgi:hypothetical protein
MTLNTPAPEAVMRPVAALALLLMFPAAASFAAEIVAPNGGRGAGTVPVWNPSRTAADTTPLTVRVLVLNYDPIVPSEGHKRLTEVFGWNNPARLAIEYKEAMEYAAGGYLRFEIAEWRNINEIYAREDGHRFTVEEYVRNRRGGNGWGEHGNADYPRLLREQHVVPLVDDGRVDEVWIFSDHFFGVYEASMAGPGAFFINGGVYPQVPSRRPFAFYGFNYERGVAEMMHDACHRTEATLNRAYGPWNLKDPKNNWEKFSANDKQSGGVAGVGTCHWPANAEGDYDYGNRRTVSSWADGFLSYPKLDLTRTEVSRSTWSKGPDYHLDYMKWYFAHVPRAPGVNPDGRQNNWFKYIFDFQSYDARGRLLPPSAELISTDIPDPKAATHTLLVAYHSGNHIDPASLGDDDLAVTGPAGKRLTVKLVGGSEPGGRSYRVARYEVAAPDGSWERTPQPTYSVALRAGHVRTEAGETLPAGPLGSFRLARAGSAPEPLAADTDTTLLAHFEGDARSGTIAPVVARGLRYTTGAAGRGVNLTPGSALSYRSRGVLAPKAGSIEFWVRPSWEGNAGKSHVFFQAGDPFNNSMLLQVDGANNLRFMVWGDDPATPAVESNVERGVGTSVAAWKAGEWHHVAATWDRSGQQLALYMDGRTADATNNGIILRDLSQPSFWVGAAASGESSADAVLDELRISRRARTANEVRSTASAIGGTTTLAVEISSPLPLGARDFARAVGRTTAGLTQDLTRAVAWRSSDPATLTVDSEGHLHALRAGEATLTARLGTLSATVTAKVRDPRLPQTRLIEAPEVRRPGSGDVIVVVGFDAPEGLRVSSLRQGNLALIGPTGLRQFPDVARTPAAEGRGEVKVPYRITPPAGKWREADRGVYKLVLQGLQVSDEKGSYAPETVLGEFRVLMPPADR